MLLDLLFHHHRHYSDISSRGFKWYVKRKKKIHFFDTAQDADAFINAEEVAEKVIAKAQKTSRKVQPVETVDVEMLGTLAERFVGTIELPAQIAQQEYAQIIAAMQDEDDIEMLLIAC